MMKTRDQSLFDEMFKRSLALEFKTFDYKPTDATAYPFVEFETTEMNFNPNKTDLKGTVYLRISVWGLQKKRKQISDMASQLFNEALKIKQCDGRFWTLNTRSSQIRMLDDASTNTPLKRALLELEFTQR